MSLRSPPQWTAYSCIVAIAALLPKDVDVRERGDAAGRMAGVGRAVPPHAMCLGRPERLRDPARHDHAAERQVARRHALREDDHVRRDTEALSAEPGAEPAEAAD